MYISQVLDIGATPSMSTILGGSTNNQKIIDRINDSWSNQGGVVFGKQGDPFKDRYQQFRNVVTNVIKETTNLIKNTYDYIMGDNRVVAITSENALNAIPPVMQPHILTYAPIRALFEKEQIYGWGIDSKHLSKEDVVGRLISNGQVTDQYINDKWEMPETMEWEWNCSDPLFKIEELEDIDSSRLFIDGFIQRQMQSGGGMEDPTDYADGGIIGDLK